MSIFRWKVRTSSRRSRRTIDLRLSVHVRVLAHSASGPFRARGWPEQVADRVHVAARTIILRGRSGKLRVTCAAGSQWNGSARAAGGIDRRRPSLLRRGPSTIERSAGRRPAARRWLRRCCHG